MSAWWACANSLVCMYVSGGRLANLPSHLALYLEREGGREKGRKEGRREVHVKRERGRE